MVLHHNAVDIAGMKFGKLLAVAADGKDNQGRIYWICKCECGSTKRIRGTHLREGSVLGCGCDRYKKIAAKVSKHGHCSGGNVSAIYRSWAQMHARCSNPKHNRWHRYGGRGIRVCKRWTSFRNFLADMGNTWSIGRSIDRINNNGNYKPSNCRWATPKEQANNRAKKIF